jgi:adenosylcobinamide-GDP ribazoletransferase
MIRSMASAFQFLTVLPLPIDTEARHLESSMTWFPLVGAVIGLFTGFGYQLFNQFLPGTISAVAVLLIYIIVTRGLHLDGYMDTIDGFFSGRDRDRILTIMKEPTVGSFAVLGSGIWFLLLFSIIPSLSVSDHVMLHTLTRFQVLLPALFFSYPRESGTGKFFVQHIDTKKTAVAFLLVLVIAGGLKMSNGLSWQYMSRYVICLIVAVVMGLIVAGMAQKKIGGITGDVLGFSIELNHMVLPLTILIAYRYL